MKWLANVLRGLADILDPSMPSMPVDAHSIAKEALAHFEHNLVFSNLPKYRTHVTEPADRAISKIQP